jgi:hypothetical protein
MDPLCPKHPSYLQYERRDRRLTGHSKVIQLFYYNGTFPNKSTANHFKQHGSCHEVKR